MIRKSIHLFNRTVIIGLQISGVLFVVLLLAWVGLVWRLSQGPLNVDYLTNYFEKTFAEQKTGFTFDVGTTVLTWGGRLEPFAIELQNVKIRREDGTPVLAVRKAGVKLSKRNLVLLRIVPREIVVYNPSLRVIRWEDGHMSLNLGQPQEPADVYGPPSPYGVTATETDSVKLLQGLLLQLQSGPRVSILGGLRQITVTDARVFYEDRILNVLWTSKDADLLFSRHRKEGIMANGAMVLSAGGENRAILHGGAHYSFASKKSRIDVNFSSVNPARIAQDSGLLKNMSQVDLPLKGAMQLWFDPEFQPEKVRYAFGSDPGTFNAFDFYKAPVPVKSLYVFGATDFKAGNTEIRQIKVDFGGVTAEAAGTLRTGADGVRSISLNATLLDMPMDNLGQYWPETLAPDPRAWVTKNLTKGTAQKATLEMEMTHDPAAAEGAAVKLGKLGGVIDFTGLRVDYFNPLLPVTNAAGQATYDQSTFDIRVKSGDLQDMKVTQSRVIITDMDKQTETRHALIYITAKVEGPLKTALKVVDAKPLEYPKKIGIRTDEVGGNTVVDVSFKFPLHNKLAINEVDIKADAKITDARLKSLVAGLDFSGGPLDLSVTRGALKVSGNGKLAAMPISFDWTKNFDAKAAFDNKVSAKLTLDATGFKAFGVPEALKLSGTIPANVVYELKHGGDAALAFDGEITQASFAVPLIAFQKPAGTKGSLAMNLSLKNDKLQSIRNLKLVSDKTVAHGDVEFASDGATLKSANFSKVLLGQNDIALNASNKGSAGYAVNITGRQLDASSFFEGDKKPNSDADAAVRVDPLALTLNVSRVLLGKNKAISDVRLSMQRNAWQRIDSLTLNSIAGGKPLSVSYQPQGAGRTLRLEAENAGAALSVLGIAESIRDGKLVVTGRPSESGRRDMAGMVVLTDFTIKGAPVIAKLLNAMSLPGILGLLTGQGLTFKKARVDYTWTDRGQPEQPQNVRQIKLRNGKTSGASLGLTFEGSIDNWKEVYNLEGTLVPASEISKIIGIVPILGDILTAGGEGLIGANYTIKGPMDNPSVMVNPLSVLAPGILRKIFFD
jgi:hypothetical protein